MKRRRNISELGYRDDSPYRGKAFIDIDTPNGLIDMSNTGRPLYAVDETGYGKFLPPYSGMHKFRGKKVRETPMQKGGLKIREGLLPKQSTNPMVTTTQMRDSEAVKLALANQKRLDTLSKLQNNQTVQTRVPNNPFEERQRVSKSNEYWQSQGYKGTSTGDKGDPYFTTTAANNLAQTEKVAGELLEMSAFAEVPGMLAGANKVLPRLAQEASGLGAPAGATLRGVGTAEEQLKKGNDWLREWYSHPETMKKYDNWINQPSTLAKQPTPYEMTSFYHNPHIKGTDFYKRESGRIARNNLETLKNGKRVVYKGTDLQEGNTAEFMLHGDHGVVDINASDLYTSRDRFEIPLTVESAAVHEGIHAITNGRAGYTDDAIKQFREPFENALTPTEKYLTDPAEVHARIGQIRNHYGFTPETRLESSYSIFADGLTGHTPVEPEFFEMIKDLDKFKNLMNKAPVAAGAVGLGAAATLPKKRFGGAMRNPFKQEGGMTSEDVYNFLFEDDEEEPEMVDEATPSPEKIAFEAERSAFYEQRAKFESDQNYEMAMYEAMYGGQDAPREEKAYQGKPFTMSGSTAGVNPFVTKTAKDILGVIPGVTNLGIWGDKNHQARKSDHNTADAQDFGFDKPEIGNRIAEKLRSEAPQRGVKYIIFNGRIWNPEISGEWRPYKGANPHSDHVHVSYKR